jgi:hypothetical protein
MQFNYRPTDQQTSRTMKTKVKFQGFLQTVEREFPTPEAAETWLRQIGKWRQVGWTIEVSPA